MSDLWELASNGVSNCTRLTAGRHQCMMKQDRCAVLVGRNVFSANRSTLGLLGTMDMREPTGMIQVRVGLRLTL